MHDQERTIARRLGRTRDLAARTAGAIGIAVLITLAWTPAPAAAQSACGSFITFETGDSFLGIAERCGVTIPALLAQNPGVVDERDLEVGDQLRLPVPGAAQPSPFQACGAAYTVRTGDTLAEIARKCGLTIPLLTAANGPLPEPLGVHAGTVLQIPDVPNRAVADPMTLAAAGRILAAAAADSARADEAAAAERDDAAAAAPVVDLARVQGVLEAGDRCMTVRTSDGERVGIAGDVGNTFTAGQRVVLMGVPATGHDCGTSRTLELRILYRAGG